MDSGFPDIDLTDIINQQKHIFQAVSVKYFSYFFGSLIAVLCLSVLGFLIHSSVLENRERKEIEWQRKFN